jgi:mono/diheme cytochrome c family protein
MRHSIRCVFACILATCGTSIAVAQPADPALEQKARALLQAHCFKCHSHEAGKAKGDLMLDTRAVMLKGGENGPALVPGNPGKSLLIASITHADPNLKMPRSAPKLAADDIALLSAWVKAGAPWTDAAVKSGLRTPGKITAEDRRYWAFQPIKASELPAGDAPNPIDRFILARLLQEGIKPAPSADPRTLMRRMYFDVIGLPPTAEEVDEFVAAWDAAGAKRGALIENLVDRLLASPHYGERWGRHWLDVVRFAESDGYRLDSFRPHAYRYRDYVIKAFNSDMPYDRFVREQIASDELYPDNPDALVAIGFLTHSIYEFNQRNVRGQWTEMVSEVVDVTGETFMGLSVGCARCHDHKFDPILQKDYFALKAFFDGMMPSEELPYATDARQQEYVKKQSAWLAKTEQIRAEIDGIENPVRKKNAVIATSKFPKDIQAMLNKPYDQRSPLEQQLATLAYRQLVYEYEKLDTQIKGAEKDRLLALRKELAKFDADKPTPLPLCQAFREVGPQPPETIMSKKSGPIAPAFLTVLGEAAPAILPPKHQASSGRRAALAQWLTRPEHPLTSRVMVNRIWQQHFGQGLVATASDFGNLGEKPTHPELLDWLAGRFVQDGWSMKKLHRLILTSKTYQQSSLAPPDAAALQKDPDNRLLWRMTPRRLDAEQIRDAMLAVTGKLDRTVGGPSVEFKEPRRSVYLKWLRNTKEPLLDVFDIPDGFTSSARRNVTTTATQALFMINSPLMIQQGGTFADRLHKDNTTTDEQKLERAFRLAFARSPSSKEALIARKFLAEQQKRIAPPKDKTPTYETAKIPFREGKAAVITPGGAQARFQLPENAKLPGEQFTLEAFVYLRSVFEDAQVRTIASHWSGDTRAPGWALGVTGKKSAYKPQTLVLQLWGQDAADKAAYDAVFSGFHLQLNRSYYVAVAVNLRDAGDKGLTFYLKDLANDEEPMLVYATTHKVVKMPAPRGPFTIGGTVGKLERSWDGMLGDVRLSDIALPQKQLLVNADGTTKNTVGYWRFEDAPGMLQDSTAHRLTLQRFGSANMPVAAAPVDVRRAAWIDFCQVLLNANEFLYVD